MSVPLVKVRDGVELPLPQAIALAELSDKHPGSTWHLADCGCCVCFHPAGDPTRGYVIGEDGESDYHDRSS